MVEVAEPQRDPRRPQHASRLLTSHKGVGLLLGADKETELDAGTATTMRTHLLHIREIRQTCERGRALREQAGTLTGDAAGQRELSEIDASMAARLADEVVNTHDENEPVDAEVAELPEVLALLIEVIEDHEHGVIATAELTARIGWDAKALGEALRRADIALLLKLHEQLVDMGQACNDYSMEIFARSFYSEQGWAELRRPLLQRLTTCQGRVVSTAHALPMTSPAREAAITASDIAMKLALQDTVDGEPRRSTRIRRGTVPRSLRRSRSPESL